MKKIIFLITIAIVAIACSKPNNDPEPKLLSSPLPFKPVAERSFLFMGDGQMENFNNKTAYWCFKAEYSYEARLVAEESANLYWVADTLSKIESSQYSDVVLFIGNHDVMQDNAYLQGSKIRLQGVIDTLKSRNRFVEITIYNVPPSKGAYLNTPTVDANTIEWNLFLSSLQGVTVLDSYSIVSDGSGAIKSEFSSDYLYLNIDANAILFTELEDLLGLN